MDCKKLVIWLGLLALLMGLVQFIAWMVFACAGCTFENGCHDPELKCSFLAAGITVLILGLVLAILFVDTDPGINWGRLRRRLTDQLSALEMQDSSYQVTDTSGQGTTSTEETQ